MGVWGTFEGRYARGGRGAGRRLGEREPRAFPVVRPGPQHKHPLRDTRSNAGIRALFQTNATHTSNGVV